MQSKLSRLICWIILFCFANGMANAQLRCISCDSTRVKNCAVNPMDPNIAFDACQSMLESCAMSIVGEITYRGCSDSIPKADKRYYRECKSNLCNDAIWPPGRMKCYQCEGKECAVEQTKAPLPCEKFLEEDGCYTDVVSETEVYRGCQSDDRNLTSSAIKCPHNACNFESGISKRTCLVCDDEKTGCKRSMPPPDPSKQCLINETIHASCTVEFLLGRANETCFVHHRLNKVERGCTKLHPELAQDAENTLLCDGDMCNNVCLNATQCIICKSSDDDRCHNSAENIRLTTCAAEQSSCFARIIDTRNGDIERGCGAPHNLEHGYECQGNGCNAKDLNKCYRCSSDKDPNCSQWSYPNAIDHEICKDADAECLIMIGADNFTIRGCQSAQVDCNALDSVCHKCVGPLCNSGIFPPQRLKCHQCRASEICNRDQRSNGVAEACTTYDTNDECIEYADNNGHMVRGCKSNLDLHKICISQGDKCLKCSSDGCNFHKFIESPQLLCFTCNDAEEPFGSCAWTPDNKSLAVCKQDVLFYNKEYCFMQINDKRLVSRGCSTLPRASLQLNGAEDEKLCFSNGCNNLNVKQQTCIQCRSDENAMEGCNDNATTIKPSVCTEPLQHFQKRGCFIKMEANDVVSRGCSFNLTDDELLQCNRTLKKNCFHCRDDSCNTFSAPDLFGSATKQIVASWIIALAGIAMFY